MFLFLDKICLKFEVYAFNCSMKTGIILNFFSSTIWYVVTQLSGNYVYLSNHKGKNV